MIYYTISKTKEGYRVWKNTSSRYGLAFKGIFTGTKSACIKYCKDNNIEVVKNVKFPGTTKTR